MLWKKYLAVIVLWFLGLFNRNVIKPEIIVPKQEVENIKPTITVKPEITKFVPKVTKIADTTPWGVALQVDEHTWTMRVNPDEKMGTAKEIFDVLNKYRNIHGSRTLNWDDKLAEYATSRAIYFSEQKSLDGHKGFEEKLKDEAGYRDLGFWSMGENASFGYKFEAVHLIEWMYAGDKPHNDNQLDNSWTHVGIGVDGVSTALIFGKNKI